MFKHLSKNKKTHNECQQTTANQAFQKRLKRKANQAFTDKKIIIKTQFYS